MEPPSRPRPWVGADIPGSHTTLANGKPPTEQRTATARVRLLSGTHPRQKSPSASQPESRRPIRGACAARAHDQAFLVNDPPRAASPIPIAADRDLLRAPSQRTLEQLIEHRLAALNAVPHMITKWRSIPSGGTPLELKVLATKATPSGFNFEVALVQKTDRFHQWHSSLHERQGAPPRLQSKLRHSLVGLLASLRVDTNWKSVREVARRASH